LGSVCDKSVPARFPDFTAYPKSRSRRNRKSISRRINELPSGDPSKEPSSGYEGTRKYPKFMLQNVAGCCMARPRLRLPWHGGRQPRTLLSLPRRPRHQEAPTLIRRARNGTPSRPLISTRAAPAARKAVWPVRLPGAGPVVGHRSLPCRFRWAPRRLRMLRNGVVRQKHNQRTTRNGPPFPRSLYDGKPRLGLRTAIYQHKEFLRG
jgi:hypothetical protein